MKQIASSCQRLVLLLRFGYLFVVCFLWACPLLSINALVIKQSLSSATYFRMNTNGTRFIRHKDAEIPVNKTEVARYMADIRDVLYPNGKFELEDPDVARILSNTDNHPSYKAISVNYTFYPVDCSALGYRFEPISSIVDDKDTKVWVVREVTTDELYIWKRYKLFSHYSVEMTFFSAADHKRLGRPLCTLMETPTGTRKGSPPGVILDIVLGVTSAEYFAQFTDIQERTEHVSRIASQVYDTYKYLHWLGYTHGDVKPSNVIIDTNGDAIIIDFGYSLPLPYYKFGQGTPNTIAPELVKYYDGPYLENTDWYSFAQMLVQWAVRSEPGMGDHSPSKFWTYKYELADYPVHLLSNDFRQLLFYFVNVDRNQRRFHTRRQQKWLENLPFWRHHNFNQMQKVWDPMA
jgi:hypothetical protein